MSRPAKMTQKRFQALHDAVSRGLDEWEAEADGLDGLPEYRADLAELVERIEAASSALLILHDRFPEQTRMLDR